MALPVPTVATIDFTWCWSQVVMPSVLQCTQVNHRTK